MIDVKFSRKAATDVVRLKKFIIANGGYQTTVNKLDEEIKNLVVSLSENANIGRPYQYDNSYREAIIFISKSRACTALYKYNKMENQIVIIALKDGRELAYHL